MGFDVYWDGTVQIESGDTNMVRWGGQYFKWWLEEQPGYAMWTRYSE